MKVLGFAGYSGAGKTTLIERLIPVLRRHGQRVSVIKHAHHRFDIDHPGKDSWRHREAGAFEVLIASDQRLALMREFEQPLRPHLRALIATLDARVDWVLVEGYKHNDLPKIEVWRALAADRSPRPSEDRADRADRARDCLYPHDPHVIAIATDRPDALPQPTSLPVFALDDADTLARWLLAHAARLDDANKI
ncbi:MAG: molybdopterin-guanine dinucleotide biosynthesis protein B [Burkholderiaceae bacterium]|jgi:molybdopterin-guanine dinucleotide biosynthesis protein B|nr:molybdopterin-guanine dinucleotide biosynthesis protein B [Burkholderiaceae bacterium]